MDRWIKSFHNKKMRGYSCSSRKIPTHILGTQLNKTVPLCVHLCLEGGAGKDKGEEPQISDHFI